MTEEEVEARNEQVISEAAKLSLESGGQWVPIIVEHADGSTSTASIRAKYKGALEVR
jgi:hypothetical protein